jgi:hypothetical protein
MTLEQDLRRELAFYKEENADLRARLSKYTNPERTMRYYERNREKIRKQQKEYRSLKKAEKSL